MTANRNYRTTEARRFGELQTTTTEPRRHRGTESVAPSDGIRAKHSLTKIPSERLPYPRLSVSSVVRRLQLRFFVVFVSFCSIAVVVLRASVVHYFRG